MFEDVKNMTTEELEFFVRKDYEERVDGSNTDLLFAVLEELAARREAEGVKIRPVEEAWAEFVKYYMPELEEWEPSDEMLRACLAKPYKLTPSLGGKECLGNGNWPGYECQCCDCDWFLQCFPDKK